ncbi:MAG TPA: hypothetical protein VHA33_29300 [Candidatus Angelobacter sp.]|jgi:hypothetical protein|nr:hypothetical protein [Candidatus Angelobacter sp.]
MSDPRGSRQLGLVAIRRKRGRIAGFGSPSVPVEVLWCGTNRPRRKFGNRRNGWSFPPRVRELLLQETEGRTVLHLFGGQADFGVRMDIDPLTRPDAVGDAYFPPFPEDCFDVVIVDPPYTQIHQQEKMALMWAAAFVARQYVYWFSTNWISTDRKLPLQQAWLIRVGDQCAIRCLQKFAVRKPKHRPLMPGEFERGEPLKYNRWNIAQQTLFDGLAAAGQILVDRGNSGPEENRRGFLGDWQ